MKPTDYMSQPEEIAKQPKAGVIVQRIANAAPPEQRAAAFNAMWSFWNFSHAFDDLVDGADWPAERKELAWKALQEFVTDLLLNPFYTQHAGEWRALFTSAIARNLDGDAMAQSGNPERMALAPAVRCADIDVMVHFAYLIGGWPLMREIGKARNYDKPDQPLPEPVPAAKQEEPNHV